MEKCFSSLSIGRHIIYFFFYFFSNACFTFLLKIFEKVKELGIWVNKLRMELKFYDEGKPSKLTERKIQLLDHVGFERYVQLRIYDCLSFFFPFCLRQWDVPSFPPLLHDWTCCLKKKKINAFSSFSFSDIFLVSLFFLGPSRKGKLHGRKGFVNLYNTRTNTVIVSFSLFFFSPLFLIYPCRYHYVDVTKGLIERMKCDIRSGRLFNMSKCSVTLLLLLLLLSSHFHYLGNTPTKYRTNKALGRWVSTQRANYKRFQKHEEGQIGADKLPTGRDELIRRIGLLDELGFSWTMIPEPEEEE